nr:uncharacterized protein LOC109193683 [Ipomoea batatas]
MDKPPTGLTKVNVDATLNHNGSRMGFGFVLRDSTGLFVVAKEVPWNALFKPREAEAVGVREPIKWLKDIHVDDVQYPTTTRALKNAVVKISAESYEYWVFRSPESVKAAQLEPPDYSQPEKYVPKRMVGSSTAAPAVEPTERGRVMHLAPSGPKKPRPMVTLGGNKAAPSTEAATVTPQNFN